MDIKRNGTQPSGKGPVEWFTGTVRIAPLTRAGSGALNSDAARARRRLSQSVSAPRDARAMPCARRART
jgi:hypothetical protein